MTESEYFGKLEMRVCRELAGMREPPVVAGLWCDGFIPEDFDVVGNRCRITGDVWIGRGGRHQECWRFTLRLGGQTLDRETINWHAMLPAEDVTGWLSLDFKTKFMTIDPSAAHADLQPDMT